MDDIKPSAESKHDRHNPCILRSVVREEILRDILNRYSRTTISCKMKHPELLRPENICLCCVPGNQYIRQKHIPLVLIKTASKTNLRFFKFHKTERAGEIKRIRVDTESEKEEIKQAKK